jgi:hypothetical protein
MSHTQRQERRRSEEGKDPRDCAHTNLVRVESDINNVDTDVLLYVCSSCQRTFTLTDY